MSDDVRRRPAGVCPAADPPLEVPAIATHHAEGAREVDRPIEQQAGSTVYPNEPGLLDNVADKLGLRAWLEQRPALKQSYRICVGLFGLLVLTTGLVMIPFPGPGWLVVIAGLAILATEFAWAERLLRFTKRNVLAWTRWVNSQPIWIRLVIGLATAAFVYGVVVVTLKLAGVPGWVPAWIPLWH